MGLRRLIATVTCVGACATTPEQDFIVVYEVQHCALYATCATKEMLRAVDERECNAFLRATKYPQPPDCTYDAELAATCLEELQAQRDDTDLASVCLGVDPVMPESCDAVYGGCALPEMPKSSKPGEVPAETE